MVAGDLGRADSGGEDQAVLLKEWAALARDWRVARVTKLAGQSGEL